MEGRAYHAWAGGLPTGAPYSRIVGTSPGGRHPHPEDRRAERGLISPRCAAATATLDPAPSSAGDQAKPTSKSSSCTRVSSGSLLLKITLEIQIMLTKVTYTMQQFMARKKQSRKILIYQFNLTKKKYHKQLKKDRTGGRKELNNILLLNTEKKTPK